MKKLIFILFACLANVLFAKASHPHHSSHSSHHSASHTSHSTHHTSSHVTSHPYNHTTSIHKSDIHTRMVSNHLMYYYLLHNKNTNKHDTIYAKSEKELQSAVHKVSEDPTERETLFTYILFGCLCLVGIIIFIKTF